MHTHTAIDILKDMQSALRGSFNIMNDHLQDTIIPWPFGAFIGTWRISWNGVAIKHMGIKDTIHGSRVVYIAIICAAHRYSRAITHKCSYGSIGLHNLRRQANHLPGFRLAGKTSV